MKDILIQADGTPLISDGDFVDTSFGEYIAQKIYRALMNIGPADISGTDETRPETTIQALESYFAQYFAIDPDVEPSSLKIELVTRSGQGMRVRVPYRGQAPDGTISEVTKGMDYNMAAGSILSIDYDPPWLRHRDDPEEDIVTFYITVPDHTTTIELPLEPVLSAAIVKDGMDPESTGAYTTSLSIQEGLVDLTAEVTSAKVTAYPIYLCAVTTATYPEAADTPFTFEIDSQTLMYPVSRYITDFDPTTSVVTGATVTAFPTGADIRVRTEVGEVVVTIFSGSGTVTGTAQVVTAKYVTYDYMVDDTQAATHVFPLRPTRGRYTAVFPKSVAPGTYMLQYRGNIERKVF